ncbi:hypothetical protein VTK73DRAFT_1108 [Phialemonium thermophilum]|uniref:DASH complex subunit SPC19 n=1 Tax=Phialemonium thermophilum TaxID=223376 RepID=A0ABR3XBV6_9PEZI
MSTSSTPSLSVYADCVASLRTSLSYLESSVTTLASGVADLPRLVSVLRTVRHYELVPQSTLAAAEASLRDEIGPFIALLLDRVDNQLERQARRIETLKARAELNAGRLSAEIPSSSSGLGSDKPPGFVARGRGISGEGALKAKIVKQRKEALKYSVERLELQVLQKERELRIRLESA